MAPTPVSAATTTLLTLAALFGTPVLWKQHSPQANHTPEDLLLAQTRQHSVLVDRPQEDFASPIEYDISAGSSAALAHGNAPEGIAAPSHFSPDAPLRICPSDTAVAVSGNATLLETSDVLDPRDHLHGSFRSVSWIHGRWLAMLALGADVVIFFGVIFYRVAFRRQDHRGEPTVELKQSPTVDSTETSHSIETDNFVEQIDAGCVQDEIEPDITSFERFLPEDGHDADTISSALSFGITQRGPDEEDAVEAVAIAEFEVLPTEIQEGLQTPDFAQMSWVETLEKGKEAVAAAAEISRQEPPAMEAGMVGALGPENAAAIVSSSVESMFGSWQFQQFQRVDRRLREEAREISNFAAATIYGNKSGQPWWFSQLFSGTALKGLRIGREAKYRHTIVVKLGNDAKLKEYDRGSIIKKSQMSSDVKVVKFDYANGDIEIALAEKATLPDQLSRHLILMFALRGDLLEVTVGTSDKVFRTLKYQRLP